MSRESSTRKITRSTLKQWTGGGGGKKVWRYIRKAIPQQRFHPPTQIRQKASTTLNNRDDRMGWERAEMSKPNITLIQDTTCTHLIATVALATYIPFNLLPRIPYAEKRAKKKKANMTRYVRQHTLSHPNNNHPNSSVPPHHTRFNNTTPRHATKTPLPTPTRNSLPRAVCIIHLIHPRRLPGREPRITTPHQKTSAMHSSNPLPSPLTHPKLQELGGKKRGKKDSPTIIRIIHIIMNIIQPGRKRATVLTRRTPARRRSLQWRITHAIAAPDAGAPLEDMEQSEPMANLMGRGTALIERGGGSTGDGLRQHVAAVLIVGGAAGGGVGGEVADA